MADTLSPARLGSRGPTSERRTIIAERTKILLSAYACLPHRGSEPGIGWNTATYLSEHADVWVLTNASNRESIEAELAEQPNPHLHFSYLDTPVSKEALRWQLHYLWWQVAARAAARRLHEEVGFDVVQHVSYVRHWTPSGASTVPVPFIWGPVGGAEDTRLDLDIGRYGQFFEVIRGVALRLGSLNPWVRQTARETTIALATSRETQRALQRWGVPDVRLMSPVGAPDDTVERGRRLEAEGRKAGPPIFASVTGRNRLMHWKGFHLGIRAFAAADLQDGEYHVFGSGRQEERLKSLARELGVADQVIFWGDVSRETMLDVLDRSYALVHPGIHDAGATVIPEAMSLGVPVLCLDTGGPGVMVDDATGFRAPFGPLDASVAGLANAMRRLATEDKLLERMRAACYDRARNRFAWAARIERYLEIYEEAMSVRASGSAGSTTPVGARSARASGGSTGS